MTAGRRSRQQLLVRQAGMQLVIVDLADDSPMVRGSVHRQFCSPLQFDGVKRSVSAAPTIAHVTRGLPPVGSPTMYQPSGMVDSPPHQVVPSL